MKNQISEKVREFTKALSDTFPQLLKKYPLPRHEKEVKFYAEFYSPHFISPKLIKTLETISAQFDDHAVAVYHKLLISTFILDTLAKWDSQKVPATIKALYHKWFERVYRDFSTQPDSYYRHDKDAFRKDMAVCRSKAIPVGGAWMVEPTHVRTGYLLKNAFHDFEERTKKHFIKKQLMRRIRGKEMVWTLPIKLRLDNKMVPILMFILERLDVFKLYYAIHTYERYLPRFTKEHMHQAYLNIAELLKTHVNIRGIYRESWFLDPKLKDISPELNFLWQVPQQNGASLFCIGSSEKAVKRAIALSPKRKKLYEGGSYRPMNYAYVWPRKEFLQWAKEHR